MKQLATLLLATAALHLSACVKPVEVTHQGPAMLQSDTRTYAVVDHPVGSTLSTNDVFQQRIHDAMARKGYAPAPAARADLLVSFKTLVMPLGQAGSAGSGEATSEEEAMRQAAMLPAGGGIGAEDVRKVVLVMLEDAATDKVLWVGWSSGEYPSDEVVTRTTESVEQILDRLPRRAAI